VGPPRYNGILVPAYFLFRGCSQLTPPDASAFSSLKFACDPVLESCRGSRKCIALHSTRDVATLPWLIPSDMIWQDHRWG